MRVRRGALRFRPAIWRLVGKRPPRAAAFIPPRRRVCTAEPQRAGASHQAPFAVAAAGGSGFGFRFSAFVFPKLSLSLRSSKSWASWRFVGNGLRGAAASFLHHRRFCPEFQRPPGQQKLNYGKTKSPKPNPAPARAPLAATAPGAGAPANEGGRAGGGPPADLG